MSPLLLFVLTISFVTETIAKGYKQYDKVDVAVNTVGPFHNPTETYQYYSLPFCSPTRIRGVDVNLGGTLTGDRPRTSVYEISFLAENKWMQACKAVLTQNDIKRFMRAIKNHYTFELFIDDLPVKGFIGEVEEYQEKFAEHSHNETHYYLFTHLDFSIAYNRENVIAVNMTTDPRMRVELKYGDDIEVKFTYATTWKKTNVVWIDRMSLHSKSLIANQPLKIHWLSILNSVVLVLLLSAFTYVVLLQVLKRDFSRYMEVVDEDIDETEETGWKLVHGDVFRFPPWPMLFCAIIGTGVQMLVLAVCLLLLALVGTFYPGNRGAFASAATLLYALTAAVAGYISSKLYTSFGQAKWASCAVLTAVIFAGPLLAVFSVLNTIAIHYGSSQALPFTTILVVASLWALVTFPLTITGAVRGRNAGKPFEAPCKTKQMPREIPAVRFYHHPIVYFLVAGFLPFSAIYIEIHYLFVSIWGHHVYTLFGILTLAFIMLIIVTGFVTVTLTYFQLANEDHRWWWRSFASGGAAGAFMFAYAVYYYKYRSQMYGTLQTAYFFGYTLMLSYAFSLMLGSVSYFVAVRFVKHIYASIHID